jgi:hypothetical protein
MMGIRILCFVLMVLITPYGWYTWVLAAAAVFLPYIAVVSANVGNEARRDRPEDPKAALPATAPQPPTAVADRVIRIEESRPAPPAPAPSERPDAPA